jgi:hypothetical protein
MALRAPAFRVIKHGATLDQASYTRQARIGSRTVTDLIDVGRVYAHFSEGATIVLQGLHRYWQPVTELCRELERELTHPVQANAYVTPPVAQGLRVHADPHDVFALQTYGRKNWVVYEGGQTPAPDGSDATPTMDIRLGPGDCLYLPKGTHHAARTIDSSSIHLTLGVRAMTWREVLQGQLDGAVASAGLDDPLPAGFAHNPALLADEAARRLSAVAEAVRGGAAPDALHAAARRFWTGRVPALHGQLQQLMVAAEIDDQTRVRRRPDAMAELQGGDGAQIHLLLADRTLRLPMAVEPALRQLLDSDVIAVGDLHRHLDEASRIVLVRRLVREGVLMVVDA